MYVLLDGDEQNQPDAYPEWCDLNWFHNCRGISGDVEPHYHDAPEIWLWHEGRAEAVVDGRPVSLHAGVMVYTPAGCLHSYAQQGPHSNTGIVPRLHPSMRPGHLHVEETGEELSPQTRAFCLGPDGNGPTRPVVLPPDAFLRSAYRGRYRSAEEVLQATTDGWVAVLTREGTLEGTIDGSKVEVARPGLLIMGDQSVVRLRAGTDCEVAFAVGWPREPGAGQA